MKRFFGVFLALGMALCLLPIPVRAAGSTWHLRTPDLRVTIPKGHSILTTGTEADPAQEESGTAQPAQAGNAFLIATDRDFRYDIMLTAASSTAADFCQVSDAYLNAVFPVLQAWDESLGFTVTGQELYTHSQTKFVKAWLFKLEDGDPAYSLQYVTVYNGMRLEITLHADTGEVDSAQEALLQKVVDSVRFDEEPRYLDSPALTEPFLYTDPESGLSFTVPANWTEGALSEEERVYLDARFDSCLNKSLLICFSSIDFYGMEQKEAPGLLGVKKWFQPRETVGNDDLPRHYLAEMFACEESEISTVTLNEKEYFTAEVFREMESGGVSFAPPISYLVRCENGFLYFFQFSDFSENPHYQDFIDLVSSAEYPEFEGDSGVRALVAGSYIILALFLFGAVSAVLILVPVRILRKRRRAREQEARAARPEPVASAPVPLPAGGTAAHRFCYKCGTRLPPGALFCHRCGAKIPGTGPDAAGGKNHEP